MVPNAFAFSILLLYCICIANNLLVHCYIVILINGLINNDLSLFKNRRIKCGLNWRTMQKYLDCMGTKNISKAFEMTMWNIRKHMHGTFRASLKHLNWEFEALRKNLDLKLVMQ